MFKDILGEQALNFEFDVNVCRYVDGEKELLNEDGQITVEKAEKLMKEKKATFQFHQPQRYADLLWNMLEKLESNFGSLVGSNVYITPADSQGLAPHCDDVEIFVMQMEGKKNWKVYKPQVELSRDYTQDLPQDSLGPPIMDITLEVGRFTSLKLNYLETTLKICPKTALVPQSWTSLWRSEICCICQGASSIKQKLSEITTRLT